MCVGGGGGSPIRRFSVIVEGVPLKSFPDFHGVNNWTPEFIPWKTAKLKFSSRALAFPMGRGWVRGRLIPMETYRALVIFQGDSDPMWPS